MPDLVRSLTGHIFHSARSILLVAPGMLAATSLTSPCQSFAQSTAAPAPQSVVPRTTTKPKFEVASIRLGCGGDGRGGPIATPASSPGRLSTCSPLVDPAAGLIADAYGRYANGRTNPPWAIPRIEGGPRWLGTDLYDINAIAEGGASEEMMRGPMMQALLEERFKLKLHRETREAPVYELRVAKGGPKLKPFREGTCIPWDWTNPPGAAPPSPNQRYCDSGIAMKNPPDLLAFAQGATPQAFAFVLGLALDRPVIDKTELTGLYDFDLEFGRDQAIALGPPRPPGARAVEPSDAPPGPSIFTAVQEQLGLKLESAKGTREVLVIDSVERPSEN